MFIASSYPIINDNKLRKISSKGHVFLLACGTDIYLSVKPFTC